MECFTLTTFMIQTSSQTRSVHLRGSWDNFRKLYPMDKDTRKGAGHWRGCHKFENIVCDGDPCALAKTRDGGLRMGGKYWYYYELDGDVECHNPHEPSTSACPVLPGQIVNVLEIPFEIGSESPRDRSGSVNFLASIEPVERTMDPADKYISPRPAPTPRPPRLATSPTALRHSRSQSLSPTTCSSIGSGRSSPGGSGSSGLGRFLPFARKPSQGETTIAAMQSTPMPSSVSPVTSRASSARHHIVEPDELIFGQDDIPRRELDAAAEPWLSPENDELVLHTRHILTAPLRDPSLQRVQPLAASAFDFDGPEEDDEDDEFQPRLDEFTLDENAPVQGLSPPPSRHSQTMGSTPSPEREAMVVVTRSTDEEPEHLTQSRFSMYSTTTASLSPRSDVFRSYPASPSMSSTTDSTWTTRSPHLLSADAGLSLDAANIETLATSNHAVSKDELDCHTRTVSDGGTTPFPSFDFMTGDSDILGSALHPSGFQGYSLPEEETASAPTVRKEVTTRFVQTGPGATYAGDQSGVSLTSPMASRLSMLPDFFDDLSYLGDLITQK
ncbi:MAG: hypothetical protein M1838_001687 [Thelocarpon superellum]|nr:MAG: hypothetical protein M1838_001687 [Thelocarpon superellum]